MSSICFSIRSLFQYGKGRFFLFNSENTKSISYSSSISSLKSIIAAAKTFFFANIANESSEVENSLFPTVVYNLNVANHDSRQRVQLCQFQAPRGQISYSKSFSESDLKVPIVIVSQFLASFFLRFQQRCRPRLSSVMTF